MRTEYPAHLFSAHILYCNTVNHPVFIEVKRRGAPSVELRHHSETGPDRVAQHIPDDPEKVIVRIYLLNTDVSHTDIGN